MEKDRVKSKAKETEGEIQQKWGEAKGKARNGWEAAKDKAVVRKGGDAKGSRA